MNKNRTIHNNSTKKKKQIQQESSDESQNSESCCEQEHIKKVVENGKKLPRGVKKENLPTKICVSCQRPFNWRKKWERCWDEVTTCSKSCNN